MSEKQEDKSKKEVNKNVDDIPKPQSTNMAKKDENKDQNEKEGERSLEEIEKELDELRPKPPSPETKRRIEEEEKEKDDEFKEHHTHKGPSLPIKANGSDEDNSQHHKDNELTPGQPDPTVNDNVKIPVLNDRGEVELKPQQGSAFKKHKSNNSPNNNQSTEQDKKRQE